MKVMIVKVMTGDVSPVAMFVYSTTLCQYGYNCNVTIHYMDDGYNVTNLRQGLAFSCTQSRCSRFHWVLHEHCTHCLGTWTHLEGKNLKPRKLNVQGWRKWTEGGKPCIQRQQINVLFLSYINFPPYNGEEVEEFWDPFWTPLRLVLTVMLPQQWVSEGSSEECGAKKEDGDPHDTLSTSTLNG